MELTQKMKKKLYAYLNIENPMVAWEVAIGRIKSICFNNEKEFGVSLWFYGLMEKYIRDESSKRVINEFKLELVRQKNFADKVSRLNGVYFFNSLYHAEAALDRWGLSHRKQYLSEVCFEGSSFTELDSEWITAYLNSDDTDWMPKYWSGETLGVNPLTEVIASGIGVIQNEELRERACKLISEKWPDSTVLLMACAAAFHESKIYDIGLTHPGLVCKNNDVEGSYFISMDSFNKNEIVIADSIRKAESNGQNLPYTRPKDPSVIFALPDLRDLGFILKDKQISDIFEEIKKRSQ